MEKIEVSYLQFVDESILILSYDERLVKNVPILVQIFEKILDLHVNPINVVVGINVEDHISRDLDKAIGCTRFSCLLPTYVFLLERWIFFWGW